MDGVGDLHHLFRRAGQGDLNGHRVLEHGGGQFADAVGHRGAEEQGLTLGAAVFGDAVDVAEKTHVEHAVRLVEDENIQFAQVHVAKVHVADHAARCDNGDVDARGEGVLFAVEVTAAAAAIDGDAGGSGEIAESLAGLVDLQGELPGGRDDEAFDVVSAAGLVDVVHRRKQEGGGLSGSRLGDANQVAALGDGRDGHGLDRCGDFEAHGVEAFLHRVAEGQFLEREFGGLLGCRFGFGGFVLGVPGRRVLRLGFFVARIGLGRIGGSQRLVGVVRVNHVKESTCGGCVKVRTTRRRFDMDAGTL